MFNNLGFRLIKILDIGYTTIIYFVLAIIIAIILDNLHIIKVDEYKENKKMNNNDDKKNNNNMSIKQIMNLIGIIWLNGIIIYFARNIIEFIPSPFNNIYGFQHIKLGELKTAFVFNFILLSYQDVLHSRIISAIKTFSNVIQRIKK